MKNNDLSAADSVWIATALLHKEHPREAGFPVPAIVQRVQSGYLTTLQPMTIYLHANQHCVANRPPKNARLCMLTETPDGLRRLFHDGDPVDPHRVGGRRLPDPKTIPADFQPLLPWYDEWNREQAAHGSSVDPMLALIGTWTFGDANTYLRDLRGGWEERK